jgi:hypothetical protein
VEAAALDEVLPLGRLLALALLLLLVRRELDLSLVHVHLLGDLGERRRDPLAYLVALLVLGILLGRLAQALLGESLGLELLLAHLEPLHLRLDLLARVRQRPLVLDIRICDPGLDVVAVALQLLDLRLELGLELLLLVGILRAVD